MATRNPLWLRIGSQMALIAVALDFFSVTSSSSERTTMAESPKSSRCIRTRKVSQKDERITGIWAAVEQLLLTQGATSLKTTNLNQESDKELLKKWIAKRNKKKKS
jgi:hypothetical protein